MTQFLIRNFQSMFLLIDTSEKEIMHLALFDQNSIEHKKIPTQNRELLFCINEFLQEKKLDKKDVHGVMVVVGAGGFTSTRIATTIANSFGYVLQIPLLAIKIEQVSKVQELIPVLLAEPKGHYISASYSGEPNIT